MFGIGEQGAQGHHAGAFVHADVRELQAALMRIHGAVFEFQADRRLLGGGTQFPIGELSAQPQQILTGLGDIHIHRIKLAHGGQRLRLIGGHQRAGRERRLADAP